MVVEIEYPIFAATVDRFLATRQGCRQRAHFVRVRRDALLALRPVTFRYKTEFDPKGLPQFGLIAEEVDQIAPELVARDVGPGIANLEDARANSHGLAGMAQRLLAIDGTLEVDSREGGGTRVEAFLPLAA